MQHVFISYSRKDQKYATELAASIRARNIPIWIDSQIPTGGVWPKEILTAIEASFAMIVIMTPDSAKSEWVGKEILWAERKKLAILPLLRKECEFFGLTNLQYVDVRKRKLPPDDFFDHLQSLFEAISSTVMDPMEEIKQLSAYVSELENQVYELEEKLDEIEFAAKQRMYLDWAAEAMDRD